jgi:hypothetical protein
VTDVAHRLPLYDDLARRFASTLRGTQLYAPNHPLILKNLEALLDTLTQLHMGTPSVSIGVVGSEIVVADTPLPKAAVNLGELLRRLQSGGIERITFDKGVTVDELLGFVQAIGALTHRAGSAATTEPLPAFPHITVGRIGVTRRTEGIARDMATIQRLYANASRAAADVWESARTEGKPELTIARNAVDGLAETITQNRTALVALTAMQTYDNYTFTHMVNVSILTMGQARALGVEGKPQR